MLPLAFIYMRYTNVVEKKLKRERGRERERGYVCKKTFHRSGASISQKVKDVLV